MCETPATGRPCSYSTLDELFDALADDRRRHVLHHLIERTEPIGLRALAVRLAASPTPASADGDSLDADGLALELHHVHLPKLSATGLVTYDAERRTVGPGRDVWRVEPLLAID